MRTLLLSSSLILAACASRGAAQAQHREVMESLNVQRDALAGIHQAIAGLEREQLALRARQDDLVHEISRASLPRGPEIDPQGDPDEVDDEARTISNRLATLQASVDALAASRPLPPSAPKAGRPDPAAVYRMTIDDAHAQGPATAKVTIVACSDFQCPFCNRVVPTLRELRDIYGEELRIAYKNNPLPMHGRAMPAAIAAEAAGKQGKFWEMHDKLFANQKDLTDENFLVWAGELGLDVAKFERDVGDKGIATRIRKQADSCNDLGARGTPSFFVNGRYLSGAQPVDAFRVLIDEEATKADAKLKKGVSRKKLYDAMIKGGRTKV